MTARDEFHQWLLDNIGQDLFTGQIVDAAERIFCNESFSVKIKRAARADCPFEGETFDEKRDYHRLKGQLRRVYDVMKDGGWMSDHEIAKHTGDPVASVQARRRDFRKMGLTVDSRNCGGGLWKYRLSVSTSFSTPSR